MYKKVFLGCYLLVAILAAIISVAGDAVNKELLFCSISIGSGSIYVIYRIVRNTYFGKILALTMLHYVALGINSKIILIHLSPEATTGLIRGFQYSFYEQQLAKTTAEMFIGILVIGFFIVCAEASFRVRPITNSFSISKSFSLKLIVAAFACLTTKVILIQALDLAKPGVIPIQLSIPKDPLKNSHDYRTLCCVNGPNCIGISGGCDEPIEFL